MTSQAISEYIQNHTVRVDYSRKGGGIEIDCGELFPAIDNGFLGMTAYQNYLGGGILGSVQSSSNFKDLLRSKKNIKLFNEVEEALKRGFFELTNEEAEEWDSWGADSSFESNQEKPASAY